MDKRASDIIEQWRIFIPPETPKSDVEKVVEECFPGLYTYKDKGSHWLIITDPELMEIQNAGIPTGTIGGTLSLSLKSGKTVKAVYIKNLLQALTIKEQFEKAKREGAQ